MSDPVSAFVSQYPADEQAHLTALLKSVFQGNVPTFIDSSGTPQMATWAQGFLEDELDAQKAGDWFGATLEGFKLPANISVHDWEATVAQGEKWAALTGWKWFPTGSMLLDAYNAGTFTDPSGQTTAKLWYDKMPKAAQTQFANVSLMMDKQSYGQSVQGRQDVLEKLTGSRDYSAIGAAGLPDMNQSLKENWSAQRYEQSLRDALSKNSNYEYLNNKYGNFDANSWKAHKLQSQQDVQRRFGNTQDQSYLKALDSPLTAIQARAGAVQQIQPGKGGPTDYATSTVR